MIDGGCTYVPVSVVMNCLFCLDALMGMGILATFMMPNFYEEHDIPPRVATFAYIGIALIINWAVFSSIAPSPEACKYIIGG